MNSEIGQGADGCVVQLVGGRCGNPPTSGLPICGSCLRNLLDESDPRRRRTLAGHPRLAAGVVQQLAEDPDDQVRTQVAARRDLDKATTSRLANPDRESAPTVWRSIAATPGGATHAWELLGTDDAATLAILASNPLVDPDILDHLSRYPDPDVAWTATATLAGQPAGPVIHDRLDEARRFDGRPLADPLDPRAATAAAMGGEPGPPGTTTPAGAAAARRPCGTTLIVGVVAVCVLAAVVVALTFAHKNSGSQTTQGDSAIAGPATTDRPSTTLRSTTTIARPPSTTAPSTTAPTTTAPTTTTPTPTAPATIPPTQAPVATPPPAQPISQTFTITPTSGQFCRSADVTVNFSPSPGYVVLTDDTGAEVSAWSGPSGQTHAVNLPRPTSSISVRVTAAGASMSISGSASGDSC